MNGRRFDQERVEVRYDHLPLEILQPPAHARAVVLDLATRGRHVGYLPGAGDDVAAALEEMGYEITSLTGADLTPERLSRLDAVVIGIRAFNVRTDLAENLPALFAYVETGGTVIAQYNTLDGLPENWLPPFQLRLSRDRVTDEHATVTILAPAHPVLTTPNRITAADDGPRVRRSRREAAHERRARGAARQGLLRLHLLVMVPPASRSGPGRVSAVRESRLARQVTLSPGADERTASEPPEVPGFRTWRGLYVFVFGWFVLVVILLTAFTVIFS